jgi:hypothetical protein
VPRATVSKELGLHQPESDKRLERPNRDGSVRRSELTAVIGWTEEVHEHSNDVLCNKAGVLQLHRDKLVLNRRIVPPLQPPLKVPGW